MAIDMGLGNNLGATFKGVDILQNRTVISIKSMDITAQTYQNASSITSKLKGYVDAVKGYVGDGKAVRYGFEFDSRAIKLAIPDTMITQAQSDALSAARAYAKSQGVSFTIVVVK